MQWFLWKIRYPNFPKFILIDETLFIIEEIFNCHNNYVWANENSHSVKVGNYQEWFSMNVWVGMIDDCLLGLYIAQLSAREHLFDISAGYPLGLSGECIFSHSSKHVVS